MTLANELWSSSIISTITSDKAAQAFLNFSLFFSIDEDIYNQNTLQKSCNTLLNNIVATNGIIFPNVYQLNQTKQFNYSLSSNTKYSNNSSIRKLDEDCNAIFDIIYVNGILCTELDAYKGVSALSSSIKIFLQQYNDISLGNIKSVWNPTGGFVKDIMECIKLKLIEFNQLILYSAYQVLIYIIAKTETQLNLVDKYLVDFLQSISTDLLDYIYEQAAIKVQDTSNNDVSTNLSEYQE